MASSTSITTGGIVAGGEGVDVGRGSWVLVGSTVSVAATKGVVGWVAAGEGCSDGVGVAAC